MKNIYPLLLAMVVSFFSYSLSAQTIGVKTNLLYDATGTINLGAEVKLAERWTLDIPVNYNPWRFSDNKQMKHALLQPEARYWFCGTFNRHFLGAHLHGGMYNVGKMNLPSDWGHNSIEKFRYKGWLAGAGISYGYHWILGNRWSLEASLGVGYAYLSYDKYELCENCMQQVSDRTKHYFGPTKAAVSLIYIIR